MGAIRGAAVAIPVYQENLSVFEEISLRQIHSVLKSCPIYFVLPEGLSPSYLASYGGRRLYFKNDFFRDVQGYNRLLCSAEFYEKFSCYEYVLIAQLDSFVFSDQLEYWCVKKYDYIGAPWTFEVSQYAHTRENLPVLHRYPVLKKLRSIFRQDFLVGNGGFSLRKVGTFLRILRECPETKIEFEKKAKKFLKESGSAAANEDNFWALWVPRHFRQFRVPAFHEALRFSFEIEPQYCYQRNQNQLPFGCHGWEKHGLDFWAPFLRRYGYDL